MGSRMALRDPSDIGRIGFIGHERELLLTQGNGGRYRSHFFYVLIAGQARIFARTMIELILRN